VRNFEKE